MKGTLKAFLEDKGLQERAKQPDHAFMRNGQWRASDPGGFKAIIAHLKFFFSIEIFHCLSLWHPRALPHFWPPGQSGSAAALAEALDVVATAMPGLCNFFFPILSIIKRAIVSFRNQDCQHIAATGLSPRALGFHSLGLGSTLLILRPRADGCDPSHHPGDNAGPCSCSHCGACCLFFDQSSFSHSCFPLSFPLPLSPASPWPTPA